jgi:hypothetical protein
MAPLDLLPSPSFTIPRRQLNPTAPAGDWRSHALPSDLILESWSQGLLVGSLLIMAFITLANMRRRVLLHKLILLELLLAMSHGTFCFMSFHGYGWYLSSTAMLLYCSWFIHNLVAWLKIKPFIVSDSAGGSLFPATTGKWIRYVYLGTLCCTIPPIILQITDNFRFFNNLGNLYVRVRPYEPLFRDPWWIFTCLVLFHVVSKCYGTGVLELVKRSPRFGILLGAISAAIVFTCLDIASSIHEFIGSTDGINPWWKLSLVCKCLTDTIMLDDFKTELRRLGVKRLKRDEGERRSVALVLDEARPGGILGLGDKEDGSGSGMGGSGRADGQVEFAREDALNVEPERLAAEGRGMRMMRKFSFAGKNGQENVSANANGRLRNESAVLDERERQRQRRGTEPLARDTYRGDGRKISQLPRLGGVADKVFGGMWKRRKDEERDAPDIVRFKPEQQDPLTRQQTWERQQRQRQRPDTEDSLGADTIDGVPNNSTDQIRRSSSTLEENDDGPRGNRGNGGARGGGPDFDSIDFQTRPPGF